MKPGTPQFVAVRLQEAREARGLSAAALADLVEVRRETVYQIESARITPGPALFERLQQALRMPAAYFLDPIEGASDGDELVLFRSLSSATKPARQRALRRLHWLRRIARVVDEFVDVPIVNIPDFGLPADPVTITDDQIEGSADELRSHWALGKGPISSVTWLMENHGILIAREDLGADELDAAFLKGGDRVYVLLGADKGTDVRSRMDAAHELGHVVLHRNGAQPAGAKDPRQKLMERQAFRFASAFLLPAESFAADVWSCSLDELLGLKPKWRVSVSAMIMRAERLGLISESQTQRLWRHYSTRRWKRGEPFDDEWSPEQPVFLRRSLELLLGERVVSIDRILNDVKIPATDIEDLTGLPRGTLSEGPIPIAFRESERSDERAAGTIVQFNTQRDSATRGIS
jgi:Zn-dependent peptidase ImmA (M78 family)/transcriptional regulator with XRE-family HTH domain